MSNHTDMQVKYCGDCCDIHPIQSQYKGNRKRGAAAAGGEYRSNHNSACPACRCDWTSCSLPLRLHYFGKKNEQPLGGTLWTLHSRF